MIPIGREQRGEDSDIVSAQRGDFLSRRHVPKFHFIDRGRERTAIWGEAYIICAFQMAGLNLSGQGTALRIPKRDLVIFMRRDQHATVG